MCVHYADYVIFTDVLVQKQIIERDNIPSDKTTLVLNVPDESVFNLEPVCSVNDKQCFKVIVVSTILKRYGIQTMVKAVPLLLKDIPELKVDVVGNGEYLPEVRRMADDLGIASYINFTDYVPYEKVSAYIAQADVCVAPMNDDVGTPNKVLEYFALGKATVSSILPGLKALFDDDCISYFQPGDDVELSARILELYRNPDKRVILGRYAKEFYLKNRWPVMLQRYLAVYQRLSGQK
jgi:glycosyltransferase involved in cell wall biosynthesis